MPLARTILAVVGAASLAISSAAWAQTRSPEQVLGELEALEAPQFDASRRGDRDYVQQYSADRQEYLARRSVLAKELFEAAPDHPQVPALLTERWNTLARQREFTPVLEETRALADGDSPLALDAAYMFAQTLGQQAGWTTQETTEAIDAFIAKAPGDERGARLLYSAAQGAEAVESQLALYRRMVEQFPEARSTKYAPGKIRQLEGAGQAFELTFQNAVDGETVDLASRKGTIFVIDFWATWCGPCIAEMPHMKELYAEYRGRGVEFIGVSLDQPVEQDGLKKLLEYVETNEIAWPQYYQGAGWDGEFSTKWGVNAIPCLFVVDHEGKLHSTEARGKLEEMLPMLIKQRDAKH